MIVPWRAALGVAMNIEAYDHMRFAIARCGMAVLSLTSALKPGNSNAEL